MYRLRVPHLVLLTTITVTSAARAASAQTLYQPVALGTLGGTDSEAYAINNYGQIVGRALDAEGEPQVFCWQNGELSALFHEAIWGRHVVPTAVYSVAHGVSDTGHVIATVLTPVPEQPTLLCQSAVLFRPLVMGGVATPYPGEAITVVAAHFSSATGISSEGLYLVGSTVADASGQVHAFLVVPQAGQWADPGVAFCGPQNTLLRDLGTLRTPDEASSATAVNNHGQVVGWSYTLYPAVAKKGYTAFLVAPADTDGDGEPDDWGEIPAGAPDPTNVRMVELGTLGGHNSWARDINDAGQVVGDADVADWATHAFAWTPSPATMIDLGTLGGENSSAAAINSAGQVVGWALNAAGEKRAVIVEPADTDANGAPDQWFLDANADGVNDLMSDLNERLPSGFKLRLTEARDINDRGEIVGWGLMGSGDQQHEVAFLLLPGSAVAPGTGEGGDVGGTRSDATLEPVAPNGEAPGQPPGTGPDGSSDGNGGAAPVFGPLHFLCGVGLITVLPFMLAGLICLKRARR